MSTAIRTTPALQVTSLAVGLVAPDDGNIFTSTMSSQTENAARLNVAIDVLVLQILQRERFAILDGVHTTR